MLCRCLGSWSWALNGGGWGLDQLGSNPTLPLREKAVAPGLARVCTLHRNLCGCFSKKCEWRSPLSVWGWGSGSLISDPGVLWEGRLAQSIWSGLSWFPRSLEVQRFTRLTWAGRRNFTLPLPPGQKRQGSNKPTGLRFLGFFTCPGV